MEVINGEPVATVHTAMAEVGQGGVTVHAQIARTELGVNQVTIHPADTRVGSAGSTSASRQTYVTGGAVRAPARPSGRRSWSWDAPSSAPTTRPGPPPSSSWRSGKVVTDGGEVLADLADVLEETGHRHRAGVAPPAHRGLRPPHRTGQRPSSTRSPRTARSSRSTPSSAWVKVIELACAQDVGKALNPLSVLGQIQGGTLRSMGVAVMEEIIVDPQTAKVRSLLHGLPAPTILDTPTIGRRARTRRRARPYGLRAASARPPCRPPRPSSRRSGTRRALSSTGHRCGPNTSPPPESLPGDLPPVVTPAASERSQKKLSGRCAAPRTSHFLPHSRTARRPEYRTARGSSPPCPRARQRLTDHPCRRHIRSASTVRPGRPRVVQPTQSSQIPHSGNLQAGAPWEPGSQAS